MGRCLELGCEWLQSLEVGMPSRYIMLKRGVNCVAFCLVSTVYFGQLQTLPRPHDQTPNCSSSRT